MSIPEDAIDVNKGIIPSAIIEISENSDTETQPYLLSFSNYSEKMCQIGKGALDKKQTKNFLSMIKTIGTKIFSERDLIKLGVIIKPVSNRGDYSPLFRKLHTDVELKEAYLSNAREETGRLFFYTIDAEKTFYFVAIRGTHLDTTHR